MEARKLRNFAKTCIVFITYYYLLLPFKLKIVFWKNGVISYTQESHFNIIVITLPPDETLEGLLWPLSRSYINAKRKPSCSKHFANRRSVPRPWWDLQDRTNDINFGLFTLKNFNFNRPDSYLVSWLFEVLL